MNTITAPVTTTADRRFGNRVVAYLQEQQALSDARERAAGHNPTNYLWAVPITEIAKGMGVTQRRVTGTLSHLFLEKRIVGVSTQRVVAKTHDLKARYAIAAAR